MKISFFLWIQRIKCERRSMHLNTIILLISSAENMLIFFAIFRSLELRQSKMALVARVTWCFETLSCLLSRRNKYSKLSPSVSSCVCASEHDPMIMK